tara:strand:+ start:2311 stop:3096 length:786 start_codon:yes stop_codon:yes gene_type:complete
MNKNDILDLFDYELEDESFEESLIEVVSLTSSTKQQILTKIMDKSTNKRYEVTNEVKNALVDIESYNISEKFRNELTLLNAYLSNPPMVFVNEKKMTDLEKGDLILIGDEKTSSIMFIVFENYPDEEYISGHPVVESSFVATNLSVKINPEQNSLNTELVVLSEYSYDMGYSIINLDEGYLGFINIADVESLQRVNIRSSNYKKINHPVDSRDPHRSSLLSQMNFLSALSFENINDDKKLIKNLNVKINPNLLMERKFENE